MAFHATSWALQELLGLTGANMLYNNVRTIEPKSSKLMHLLIDAAGEHAAIDRENHARHKTGRV
jgi:hypothetical protein